MPAILFVCTANQIRSPIAAATFKQFLASQADQFQCRVESAGTWSQSGLGVGITFLRLAREVGVDLSDHRTTSIEDVNLAEYDWVAVMEKGHQEALTTEYPELREKIQLLTTLAGLTPSNIKDPVAYGNAAAVEILVDMQACVRQFARRLIDEWSS